MADTLSGEGFLLALLNSTPVVDGVPTDDLADAARARAWLTSLGGLGTDAELRHVLGVRQALQDVVRGDQPPAVLAPVLQGAASIPGGGASAALLAGPLGGMMQTQAKTFIETLKKSVREIRLTVSWPDGKERRSVSASQIVVILPESVGQAQTAPVPQIPPPGSPGNPRPGTQP